MPAGELEGGVEDGDIARAPGDDAEGEDILGLFSCVVRAGVGHKETQGSEC